MNTTLVVASGPSLTRRDCDFMRGRFPTIAVNCAVWFAPWADVLYAADSKWWSYYGPKCQWFKGEKYSITAHRADVVRWRPTGWTSHGGNSGHQALQLAVERGAKRVYLLGFDHQHTDGKTHFHGDHPRTNRVRLGNAAHCGAWRQRMRRTAVELKNRGVEVINLSRQTGLTVFPRSTVDEVVSR